MSYLSYDMDPVLTVPSGSVVRFETDDAWRGLLTGRETPYAAVKDQYPHTTADYNPVSGPVYIEEAKAGDIIRIEIQIKDGAQLSTLMNKLHQISGVLQVNRPVG